MTDPELIAQIAPAAGLSASEALAAYNSTPAPGTDCEKIRKLLIAALAKIRSLLSNTSSTPSNG